MVHSLTVCKRRAMRNLVVSLPLVRRKADVSIASRLKEVTELINVIHEYELLSALPDCPVAYKNHRLALALLARAEHEIISIYADL
jgi:hypothetical protein